MVAGALGMPPMATTTGCVPSGALWGMRRLICATPTRAAGIPSNRMEPAPVGTPPIETVVACTGTGNSATGGPAPGGAAVGTMVPFPYGSVNRPGAAEATVSVVVAVRPLLLTVTTEG